MLIETKIISNHNTAPIETLVYKPKIPSSSCSSSNTAQENTTFLQNQHPRRRIKSSRTNLRQIATTSSIKDCADQINLNMRILLYLIFQERAVQTQI